MTVSCTEKIFPETRFGGFHPVDGAMAFYLRVNALLKPTDAILDVGCGRGEYQDDPVALRRSLRIFRGKVQKVTGLDLDPDASQNPFLDEFRLLENPDAPWPIPDQSADLVVSDWTLEHVGNPDAFFGEVRRVLKTGGYFCARTTNAWGYVALASRIIPERHHVKILKNMQKKREERDIFPTLYACNNIPLLKRKLSQFGLDGVVLGFSGLPGYFQSSCALTRLAYLYERFTPPFLRHTLMVFARRK